MKCLYRVLLRLYPARFREEYAAPMHRQFQGEYREAQGWGERVGFGTRTLAELAITIPVEIARELRQDLRYSTRVYRQRPVPAILAVVALALAFGATTGIFSVLNAMLLRSLPFRQPEQLVELWLSPINVAHGRASFQAWRDGSPYLADAAGYTVNETNLSVSGGSARVRVAETTANFLRMLGTEPKFGRNFDAGEDAPERNGVAVIGYGLWHQLFGADPRALGSTVRLSGVPLTVIGVAPRGFDYPEKAAVWTPTVFDLDKIPKSGAVGWETIGRLRPGIGVAQAARMFEAEVRRVRAGRRPPAEGYLNEPRLFFLRERLAGPVRSASLVLMGVVLFVLLIACANVAHLLLSRTTERRHELALRTALGASRARLIQQLATESVVLTATAAAAGMAVAHWTARLAASAQPAQLAARQYDVLDLRVIAFALAMAVLTGIIFGVLPALLVGRVQPAQVVLRTQPGSRSLGASRMRAVLIGLQAALTMALLAGCFSLGRSFLKLTGTDLGYRTDGIVTLNVSLSGTRHDADDRRLQYYGEALERLRALPGVESAAAVSYLPLITQMGMGSRFKLDTGGAEPLAMFNDATPGYFRTVGAEIVGGRDFSPGDRDGAERVIIISDALARAYGTGPLVGRKLNLAWRGTPQWATIVGVVRSPRVAGPASAGMPAVFRPIAQSTPGFVTLVAKVRGRSEMYLAACRDAVQQIDRGVPVYDVKTFDERLASALARPRFYTTAILFVAFFALLLALLGTYGVAACSVAQRTHEIGVRIAVGASPRSVRRMLLRQSMLPICAGLLAGVAAAAGLSRFLQHLIADAQTGAAICAGAAVLLVAATGAAVWIATARIAGLDPTVALKAE